jgi:hypothetical protein
MSNAGIVLAAVALIAGVAIPFANEHQKRGELSFFLLIPTIFSAWQNVYLLPVSDRASSTSLQVLIIFNFLLACWQLTIVAPRPRDFSKAVAGSIVTVSWIALGTVLAYGSLTAVMFHGPGIIAEFGSMRDLVTPFLFLLVGLGASAHARVGQYAGYLVVLTFVVAIFGFYEYYNPGFWAHHGLADLWNAKGLSVNPATGLPGNFYSSEIVNGHQLRRMVGPFADPVNLGSFLLAGLYAAWYRRRSIIVGVSLVAIAFAVSKGAFVGILVLVAVWSYYRVSKTVFFAAIIFVAGVGLYGYSFVTHSSTGSTARHIAGLTSALQGLPAAPLGHGLGGAGVLANVLGGSTASPSDISVGESGLGVVIGQLGIVGLAVYVLFFATLVRASLRVEGRRERILAAGLVISYMINAAFNEVALSPNSAAPYFVMLGLVIGKTRSEEPQRKLVTHGGNIRGKGHAGLVSRASSGCDLRPSHQITS